MKIKSIQLKNFRRFTDIKIEEIPETAKLVMMIGPNGCGKSSVFDALQMLRNTKGFGTFNPPAYDYYFKSRYPQGVNIFSLLDENVQVTFHGKSLSSPEDWQSAFHIRSAYRNDLVEGNTFSVTTTSIAAEQRFYRLAENDQAVASNYNRLLSQWIKRSSTQGQRLENLGQLQDQVFGELRDAIAELFTDPQLVLENLGAPANNQVFQFNKGTSHGLSYQNLASGEKAALDLLLDIIVFKAEFRNTVFCIDEPEAHIHTKLQGPLLEKLYDLIPDNSQLWIATHSIGMVRKTQDLYRQYPGAVIFLDFGEHDFDEPVTLKPMTPDPDFWTRTYEVALGDLSELVASEQYVFCEGEDFDAECYQNIFGSHHPKTRFISIGGRNNVVNAVSKLKGKIAKAAKVSGIIDRDRSTDAQIKRNAQKGIRTLELGKIEDYLLDDEVLKQLCISQGKSDKVQEFLTAKDKGIQKIKDNDKIHDKRRPIVQCIQQQAETILELSHSGDTVESFMMDILAPLIKPCMKVYEQLEKDIFGE